MSSFEPYCHLMTRTSIWRGREESPQGHNIDKKDWEGERVRRDERKLFKVVERQSFLCQCIKRRLVNIKLTKFTTSKTTGNCYPATVY